MKKIWYIFVLLFAVSSSAQNNELFERGVQFYKSEKYQEAITAWSSVLENGKHSASLYFNLGNAHYKLNNIGPSVFYYEKALQLAPNDNDIKTNLAFAENARIDAIEALPKTVFAKWYERVSGVFTFDGWAVAAVVCAISFTLLFLLYYFSVSERRKRMLFAGSMFSVILFIFVLVLAFKTYGAHVNDTPAIIFAESTEVRSGPSMGGDVAFVLHEGTKVQIIDRDEDWVRIALVDGKDGWMPAADLKQL